MSILRNTLMSRLRNLILSAYHRGFHFILVCFLGVLVCFLSSPNYASFEQNEDNNFSPSCIFYMSVVTAISVTIAMSLDLVMDVIVHLAKILKLLEGESSSCTIAGISLIMSQLAPAYALVNSELSATLMISLSFSRYIMMYNGVFCYLWTTERSTFQTISYFLSYVLLVISIAAYSLNLSSDQGSGTLLLLFMCTGGVGVALLVYNSTLWFLKMRSENNSHFSASQLTCSMYIVLLTMMVTAVFVMSICISHTEDKETVIILFMTPCSIFTILLSTFQARILRYDAKQSETVLETKRNMIRFVSHEIRTPLNAVTMGLQLLREELDEISASDCLYDTLREVQASCKASLEVLNELLLFEKLDAGITSLEKEIVQVLPLFQSSVEPFVIQARKQCITLKVPSEGSQEYLILQNTYLEADAVRLTQVVRNLISNALKFTPRGGRVTVSVERIQDWIGDDDMKKDHDKVDFLRLSVNDSGAGLSKENLARLFTEIVQFDANKLQGGGGSGFGLFLCKTIVDLHRGRVFATSEGRGKGCTFTLDLPVARTEEPNIEDNTPPARKPASANVRPSVRLSAPRLFGSSSRIACSELPNTSPHQCASPLGQQASSGVEVVLRDDSSPGEGNVEVSEEYIRRLAQGRASIVSHSHLEEKGDERLRVLVVDDADSNRKVLCRLLARRFDVREAADGLIAVNIVKAVMATPDSFDVILMDNLMPNMNGPTAAQVLRAAGYNGVIIGITGNALPEDIADYVAHGADKVMVKPVYIKDVERNVAEVLNARRALVH